MIVTKTPFCPHGREDCGFGFAVCQESDEERFSVSELFESFLGLAEFSCACYYDLLLVHLFQVLGDVVWFHI